MSLVAGLHTRLKQNSNMTEWETVQQYRNINLTAASGWSNYLEHRFYIFYSVIKYVQSAFKFFLLNVVKIFSYNGIIRYWILLLVSIQTEVFDF